MSIENVNTAVALKKESCAYRALKHVRTRHICPRNTAWGDGEQLTNTAHNHQEGIRPCPSDCRADVWQKAHFLRALNLVRMRLLSPATNVAEETIESPDFAGKLRTNDHGAKISG